MDILQKLGLKKSPIKQAPVATVGVHSPGGRSDFVLPWIRGKSRKAVEEDIMNMDETDGLVARMFDHIANYTTCFPEEDYFGFKIKTDHEEGDKPTAEQADAVEILREMVERTSLDGQRCWDITRDMAKKGDVFTETVISPSMDGIVAVKQFQKSWQINKNVDRSGNLKYGDPALAMSDNRYANEAAYTQVNDMGSVVAAFWPYQIVQWGFGATSGGLYHEPLGAPGIVNWKRLNAGRDSLGVARIIRVWDTNVHVIPVPIDSTEDEIAAKIRDYQYSNERDEVTPYDANSGNYQSSPRYSPNDVARDIYTVGFYNSEGKMISGSVDKLQPSTAALQHLDDIYFGVNVMLTTFGMPIEILGLDIGNKPMVDKTKEEAMEAFSKQIKRLQFSHAAGLKMLFDLELLLNGINPLQKLYKIKYPSIIPQTAEVEAKIEFTRGQLATYLHTIGMPPELIGPRLQPQLDPHQIALWKANLESQVATSKDNDGETP